MKAFNCSHALSDDWRSCFLHNSQCAYVSYRFTGHPARRKPTPFVTRYLRKRKLTCGPQVDRRFRL